MLLESLAVFLLSTSGQVGRPTVPVADSSRLDPGIETIVASTLAQLTTEEKIDLIGGTRDFYLRDVKRLGIPELTMSDGPMGVRNYGPDTAYPAGACMASTWDPGLAEKMGQSIGRDARARGVHIWLGPGVNLARVVQNGRNFEYFGEDPLLSGKIAAGVIRGVQSQGVVATIKHYAANNHENDRNNDSSDVDERTLRELYLRQFEIAVKEGGPWAVMCSYNLVNGTHASEHEWLLNQVLKKEWGFNGIVMSDWGAVHSTKGPLLHGLDLEMPGPEFTNRGKVMPLLNSGEVPMSAIDEKVRRILRMEYAMRFDQRPQLEPKLPKDSDVNHAVALRIAREGTVLLKNNGILPLRRGRVHHVLLVGENGARVPQGGGSAWTTPIRTLTLGQALKKIAGPSIEVTQFSPYESQWDAFKKTAWAQPDDPSKPGLKVEAWNNMRLSGPPAYTGTEMAIDRNQRGSPYPGIQDVHYSVRWSGTYMPTASGSQVLFTCSDDGIRVYVNDRLVIDQWDDHGATKQIATVRMRKGRPVRFRVEYFEDEGEAVAQVGLLPTAVANAASMPPKELLNKADVVIASVGFDSDKEGEGSDRPFALPAEQEAMLEALAGQGRQLVVVNNSGAGVDMSAWIDRVPALIQAWYPGGIGSQAVAEILFGVTNPSGKLATSFPRTLAGTYYANAYPSVNRHMVYRERLQTGYRWFSSNGVKPLFPFGFGLSYTAFDLTSLQASKGKNGDVEARVDVENTGSVAGAETVQIYAARTGGPDDPAEELVGFQRVELRPGEKRTVNIKIPNRNLAHWSVEAQKWIVAPGAHKLMAGSSSINLPLHATVRM